MVVFSATSEELSRFLLRPVRRALDEVGRFVGVSIPEAEEAEAAEEQGELQGASPAGVAEARARRVGRSEGTVDRRERGIGRPEDGGARPGIEVSASAGAAGSSPLDVRALGSAAGSSPLDVRALESASGSSPLDVRASESAAGSSPLDVRALESASGTSPLDVRALESASGSSPLDVRASESASGSSPLDVRTSEVASRTSQLDVRTSEGVRGSRDADPWLAERLRGSRTPAIHHSSPRMTAPALVHRSESHAASPSFGPTPTRGTDQADRLDIDSGRPSPNAGAPDTDPGSKTSARASETGFGGSSPNPEIPGPIQVRRLRPMGHAGAPHAEKRVVRFVNGPGVEASAPRNDEITRPITTPQPSEPASTAERARVAHQDARVTPRAVESTAGTQGPAPAVPLRLRRASPSAPEPAMGLLHARSARTAATKSIEVESRPPAVHRIEITSPIPTAEPRARLVFATEPESLPVRRELRPGVEVAPSIPSSRMPSLEPADRFSPVPEAPESPSSSHTPPGQPLESTSPAAPLGASPALEGASLDRLDLEELLTDILREGARRHGIMV